MNFSYDPSIWQCQFYNWSKEIIKHYCRKHSCRMYYENNCVVINHPKRNIFIMPNILKMANRSKSYTPHKYYFTSRCSLDNFEGLLSSSTVIRYRNVFEKAYISNIKKNVHLIGQEITFDTRQVIWGKNNNKYYYAIHSNNMWKHNGNFPFLVLENMNHPNHVVFLSMGKEDGQYFMITSTGYIYIIYDNELYNIIKMCKWGSVFQIKKLYFSGGKSWFVLCNNGMYYYKNIPHPVQRQLEQKQLSIQDINIGPNDEYFIQINNSSIYIGYNFSDHLTWVVNNYLQNNWSIKNIHFGIKHEWFIEFV